MFTVWIGWLKWKKCGRIEHIHNNLEPPPHVGHQLGHTLSSDDTIFCLSPDCGDCAEFISALRWTPLMKNVIFSMRNMGPHMITAPLLFTSKLNSIYPATLSVTDFFVAFMSKFVCNWAFIYWTLLQSQVIMFHTEFYCSIIQSKTKNSKI